MPQNRCNPAIRRSPVVDVLFPKTLDHALDLMANVENPAVLAGGTDLLVQIRYRRKSPSTLVSLDRVEGMGEIMETDQEIIIRAGARLSHVMAHGAIQTHASVLAQAIQVLGSPQIRNMGTVGGNIMTASPAGDSLPPLYVLGAWVDLAGPEGLRRLALAEFITGPGQTALLPGEILWQVGFAKPDTGACHWFEKVGQRAALSISMVSLAALFCLDGQGAFSRVGLAWGSVGKTIVTSSETEAFLLGKRPEPDVLARAADLARAAVCPISDIRARASFRRDVAGRLLLRLDQAGQGGQ